MFKLQQPLILNCRQHHFGCRPFPSPHSNFQHTQPPHHFGATGITELYQRNVNSCFFVDHFMHSVVDTLNFKT